MIQAKRTGQHRRAQESQTPSRRHQDPSGFFGVQSLSTNGILVHLHHSLLAQSESVSHSTHLPPSHISGMTIIGASTAILCTDATINETGHYICTYYCQINSMSLIKQENDYNNNRGTLTPMLCRDATMRFVLMSLIKTGKWFIQLAFLPDRHIASLVQKAPIGLRSTQVLIMNGLNLPRQNWLAGHWVS